MLNTLSYFPPQVLKGERDALMKLIQSMRREYEAVQGAKGAQEDELSRLKERMLLGVRLGSSYLVTLRAASSLVPFAE